MKILEENKNNGFWMMLFAVCLGFVLYLFYELTRSPKKHKLADRINNGFEEDKKNIGHYWENIKTDLHKAYQKNTL